MRKVLVIGSTGSIGRATIEIIKTHPERLKLVAICARTYSDTFIDQIQSLRPRYTIITDPEARSRLQAEGVDVRDSGLLFDLCRSDRINTIVFAKSGIDMVEVIFEALKYKKRVCLATKEVIVSFGELLNQELERSHGEIIPIDSEH
ncbi:MAG TPA: hypothetical protein EYP24_00995, partial [bacterium (Candidatus Stahlbacteria)]|nr:hypothetical protein [Candidatus Stahlbacteria bacterium]